MSIYTQPQDYEDTPLASFLPWYLVGARIPNGQVLDKLVARKVRLGDVGAGLQIRPEAEQLWRRFGLLGWDVKILPGLVPVFLRLLGLDDEAIRSANHRKPTLSPSGVSLTAESSVDSNFIEMAARCDRFVVNYKRNNIRPECLVAQLCTAFPKSRIVVATTRRREAIDLVTALSHRSPDVALAAENRPYFELPRVCVGDYPSLVNATHRLKRSDFLIVLNAVESLGKVGRLCVADAWQARHIGLLPDVKQLAPNDIDMLRAMYGFDEVHLRVHGFPYDLPRIAFVKVLGGRRPPLDIGIVELKRQAIWRHGGRNERVSNLADALTSPVRSSAALLGNELHQQVTNSPPSKVVVMVENQEHARRIARLLPNWRVIEDAEAVPNFINRQSFRSIATFTAAPAFGDVDMLVRADGGVGVPDFLKHGDLRPSVIVDLDDNHHPALRIRSRDRSQAYRELGWYGLGEDLFLARVEEFIRSRPEAQQ